MDAYREVEKLLDRIRHLTTSREAKMICDHLEVLCRGFLSPTDDFLLDVPLKPAHRRLINILRAKMGRTVSKGALADALGFDARDVPSTESVDVHICSMRKILLKHGNAFHIVTDYALGFRLVAGPQPDTSGRPASSRFRLAA